MGFGFSKQSVLEMSGRPVEYTLGGASDPILIRLLRLRKIIDGLKPNDQPKRDFEYLMHFYKRLRFPAPQRDPDKLRTGSRLSEKKTKTKHPPQISPHMPKLKPFPYLEEQEWRIVVSQPRRFTKANESENAIWFPIRSEHNLLTVIVPDNVVLRDVIHSEALRDRLFAKNRRPIQVISHECVLHL